MKYALLLPVAAAIVCISACGTDRIEAPEGYTLVWNDEFTGTRLDESKWNAFLGGGGFGNRELQFYRPEKLEIRDGNLVITADREFFLSHPYTSGMVTTRDKASWQYGRFEFRARLPWGQGIWPAIWMKHLDSIRARYPDRPLQVSLQHRGSGVDFSYGNQTADGAPRRFHTASIGKLLTATVIVRMIEAGLLDLAAPVTSLLSTEILDGLFVLGGADHRDRYTVEQLLGHTSGVADYFAGIYGGRTRKQRFTDRDIAEPDHLTFCSA